MQCAVAAGLLRREHRARRRYEDRVGVDVVRQARRDPNAGSGRVPASAYRRASASRSQSPGFLSGPGVGGGRDHDELVGAEPPGTVVAVAHERRASATGRGLVPASVP